MTGWDGEKSQDWNLTSLSEDGRSRWTISMMEDLSLIHIYTVDRAIKKHEMKNAEESLPIWEEPSAFFSLYSSGPVL